MSQVLTEGTNLAFTVESALGVAGTVWYNLQPNSYGAVGPAYKKQARKPINKDRQNQRPILIDEDAGMAWAADITKDQIDNFVEGIFMSATKHSGGVGVSSWVPTAVTATQFTVPVNGASGGLAQYTLVYARGLRNSANNGLFVLAAASTTTAIKPTATLVAETVSGYAAQVEIAGYRAQASDVVMTAAGHLTSTLLNFTLLGLQVGQWIWIGGAAGNSFTGAGGGRGFAQITAIAAGQLSLARRSWTVGAGDTGVGKLIDLYFTRWARNTPMDSADYKQPSYTFEIAYPTLNAGAAEYEYVHGCMVSQWVWNLALTSIGVCDLTFTGTIADDPVVAGSRLTGASTAIDPLTNLGLSTATDLMRLRISNVDETGISTDFRSIKITMSNNVSPEKELGTLGATRMNVGRFEVMVEADLIFTSDDVIKAIHDNRQTTMDVAMRNGDGGALLDMPSLNVESGERKFATNESVVVSAKALSYKDPVFGYSASISIYAYLPSS